MSKRVLLIEDEADIREVYAEMLTSSGYQTIQSGDGEDGLAKALQGEWDLLLLDIMLPKKDGIDVLQEIKSNDTLRSKPIVLLTNLSKDDILDRCLQLGANSYMVKSNIEPPEVVAQVDKFFS